MEIKFTEGTQDYIDRINRGEVDALFIHPNKKKICIELEISDYAKANDKGIMEITPKNFNITPEELRAFCKDNDVFIYSNKNAVIYANESYIFIHTGESGEQNLAIPDECKLTDVFSGEEFSSKFTANIGKSFLLKKHKI